MRTVDPRTIGAIVDDAVQIYARKGYTAPSGAVLRRELAERLFRELRQEGRLTPDA